MPRVRSHIFIKGRVQGVFFRQSLKVIARKHGTVGWVRNLDDGRVEAVIDGDESSVAGVVEWCHTGPANSRIDDVQTNTEMHTDEFEKFDVLY